jgi:hypothetical protein
MCNMSYGAAILKDHYEPVPLLPGAFLVLFTDDEVLAIEARIAGLQLRDTLAVLGPGRRSRFGFLFRAPSDLTVAEQVLATGTGGLNIDASRINNGVAKQATAGRRTIRWGVGEGGSSYEKGTGAIWTGEGRWPTNVAFIHAEGCSRTGVRHVRSDGHHPAKRGSAGVWSKEGGGLNGNEGSNKYMGEAGFETVEAWVCASDCLARALDNQSGNRPSTLTGRADPLKAHGHPSSAETASWYSGGAAKDTQVYADEGGASRFYLQFPNETDFLGWVQGLITPNGSAFFDT